MRVLFGWIFVLLKSIIRLIQIDAAFRELFDNHFSKTDIDEYIDFDIEVVISLPAIDRLMVEWGQETRNKGIAEVTETSSAAAEEPNQSKEKPEIVTDEDENRKTTASEALKKFDEVKKFIVVNGSDHLNMIFNEVIENLEQMKLKNQKQNDIRSFFRS